jgi:hypothetical protein
MAVTIDEIQVRFGAEINELNKKVKQVDGKLKDTKKNSDNLGNAMKKAGGMIATYFSVQALISFGRQVVDVTAKFQRLEAQMTTALGSNSAAQMAMQDIIAFASVTPFQVDKLTEAFVLFANRGVKPTMAQMGNLGDLAAALGKDFDLLSGAIIDAVDPVRWRNLGVVIRREGDQMTGSFKGLEVTVSATTQGALEMAAAFGQMEGVAGGMARVSETLGGKISNLKDNLDVMFNSIGDANSGVLMEFISLVNDAVAVIGEATRSTLAWGKSLGASKVTNLLGTAGIDTETITNVEEQQQALAKLTEILRVQEMAFKAAASIKADYASRLIKNSSLTKEYEKDVESLRFTIQSLTDVQKQIEALDFSSTKRDLGAIEQITAKIKELENEKPTASIERLAVINRELLALNSQLKVLDRIGLQRKANNQEAIKGAKELQGIESTLGLGGIGPAPLVQMRDQMQAGILDPMNQAILLTDMMEGGFQSLFSTLAGGGNVFEAFGNYLKQLAARLAAMAATALILNAIMGGTGAIANGLKATFGSGAGFSDIFSNLLGFGGQRAMASGGIAYGPTNALVGEYPGARSNPEVVAPLNKLQGMLGGMGMSGDVRFKIEGNTLIGVLERAERTRFRTT